MNEKAKYKAFPSLSPYLNTDRYKNPKEDHKFILSKLQEIYEPESKLNVCDLGCGNGDLLYLIHQHFSNWNLTGYDFTKEFIDFAKSQENLKEINFFQKDLFEVNQKFDLVIADSVTQIFPDIEKTLSKYLEICNEKGYIFTTGRFNKYDIEVRLQYCDNSNSEAEGVWREDWSQHSRSFIKKLFLDKVSFLEFTDVIMNKDLSYQANMPINQWTFRDSEGKNIITNGTNLILNKTLLTIQK